MGGLGVGVGVGVGGCVGVGGWVATCRGRDRHGGGRPGPLLGVASSVPQQQLLPHLDKGYVAARRSVNHIVHA